MQVSCILGPECSTQYCVDAKTLFLGPNDCMDGYGMMLSCCVAAVGDPVDPEMEPDAAQQESQESAQGQEEEEDEDQADPAILAKKQKQLAKRGVTFEAKVDPKVGQRSKP